VVRAAPGPALVELADRRDDLLVVGYGGRSRLGCAVHGSVARYCLAHARCPVLAVPPSELIRELRPRRHHWRAGGFRRPPGRIIACAGAIESCRIFPAASADMTAEPAAWPRQRQGRDPGHLPRHRQGRLHPGMSATGETFAMDASYLVLVKRAGPDRRTLGHGRHHRHRGPVRPSAHPWPGACVNFRQSLCRTVRFPRGRVWRTIAHFAGVLARWVTMAASSPLMRAGSGRAWGTGRGGRPGARAPACG